MKNLYKFFLISIFMANFALANVPTIHQIFQTVSSGNLTRAHKMIEIVLKKHPRSAKAHYVAAEILVRQGNAKGAKKELNIAHKLEPNLPFVKERDVINLQKRIASLGHNHPTNKHSWVLWIVLIAAILLIYLIWKNSSRRSMLYQRPPSDLSNHNTQTPQNSGGFGSRFFGGGFFSNLLSGLVMGAGFAAGERVVDNLMDSHDSNDNSNFDQTNLDNSNDQEYFDSPDDDFGIDDSSSWDDGGSFGSDDFGDGDDSW